MAKKVAKKKTAKRESVAKNEIEAQVEEQIDAATDEDLEELEEINPRAIHSPGSVEESEGGKDDVIINVPVHLKINGKKIYPGRNRFPRHQAPTVLEMIHKKRKADLAIHTGKSVLLERLLDRTLVQKEVGDLDLKKMAR